MKVSLLKDERRKDEKPKFVYVELTNFVPVTPSRNLVLLRNGGFQLDENDESTTTDFYEIYSVLYLAHAKSDISNSLLIAMYFGEHGELEPYILDGLPENYHHDERFHLLDYQGYKEICKLTGETVLSIDEYFKEYVKGGVGINSILFHEDKKLNFQEQQKFFSEEDKK